MGKTMAARFATKSLDKLGIFFALEFSIPDDVCGACT
jgi:hypothetical protein